MTFTRCHNKNTSKGEQKMKKKTCILILMCAIMLSGCGKSQSDIYQEELGLTKEEADELADAFAEDSDNSGSQYNEEMTVNFEKSEASTEWSNYTSIDTVIQIDDTIYETGISTDDFIKRLEASDVTYTYEYNPEKLLTDREYETIKIYRDGIEWFEIHASNIYDETTMLAECPISRIILKENTSEYCHFINGTSYDSFIGMTYSDIINSNLLSGYTMTEESKYSSKLQGDAIFIEYKYNNIDTSTLDTTHWTGYYLAPNIYYYFYIDKDTSMVVDMGANISMNAMGEVEWTPISYFSELSEDEKASLVSEAQKLVTDKFICDSIEAVGSCLQEEEKYNPIQFYNFCTVFKLQKSDGTITYVDCELNHLSRKVTGKVGYDDTFVGEEKASYEEVMDFHYLDKNVTDTTLP